MFQAINDVTHVRTFWSQKVVLNVSFIKRIYKVRLTTSCFSKNIIYTQFCLSCLKQGVTSTVDWKPRLRNYKSHIMKRCNFAALSTTSLMLVETQMIPLEILDLFSLIN